MEEVNSYNLQMAHEKKNLITELCLNNFDFALPKELIAQYPLAQRDSSRLLCVGDQGARLHDYVFRDLPQMLRSGDLLVLNDTRVLKARFYGFKPTGGIVELLIERIESPCVALAQIRSRKACRSGTSLCLDGGEMIEVQAKIGNFFRIQAPIPFSKIMEQHGHIPLPPYINRNNTPTDYSRYQTIYARRDGAIAAPTAGLHFDAALLEQLQALGVSIAYVTLHVGAGTFQPVRSERLREHVMHSEWCEVSAEVCNQVQETQAKGGRIVAVGTTSVRCLESAAINGGLSPYVGETNLFIYPGYQFRVVDMLVTNFHLPRSTLLMLVCAFGGMEPVLAAYRHAVAHSYRFFSYGDAMLLFRTV